jgi:lanthanide-dependent methanol dehydrogenase
MPADKRRGSGNTNNLEIVMTNLCTATVLATTFATGMAGTALANDDVLRLSRDPANVVMPNITYNGWNYSALDQINLNNVKDLSVAWTWQVGVLDSHEASPLVVGDKI